MFFLVVQQNSFFFLDVGKQESKTNCEQTKQMNYCTCRKPDDGSFMICCDQCQEWYHGHCIGITETKQPVWYCASCERQKTRWTRRKTENIASFPLVKSNLNDSEVHTKGYMIIRQAFRVNPLILSECKTQVLKKGVTIFNQEKHNDKKRLSCEIPSGNSVTDPFLEHLKEILQQTIGKTAVLECRDWTILHSRKGCQQQAPHIDYPVDPNFQTKLKYAVQHNPGLIPLSALISLMPHTRLHVGIIRLNLGKKRK